MGKYFLFCISGYSGTGKDTFADYLINKHGAVKFGITDTARRHMMEIYGFNELQMFGPSKHRNAGDMRLPTSLFHKWGLTKLNERKSSSLGIPYNSEQWITRGDSRVFLDDTKTWKTSYEIYPYSNSNNISIILIQSGDPHFWLSPREVLQKHCMCLQDMYEEVWIHNSVQSQLNWINNNEVGPGQFITNNQTYKQAYGLVNCSKSWEKDCVIVCSDVRHKHEINYVRKHADEYEIIPIVIRVKRPGIENPPFNHRSEVEQSSIPDESFDFIINNDSDVDHLGYLAEEIISILESGKYQPKNQVLV